MKLIGHWIRLVASKDPPALEEGGLSHYGNCKWYAAAPGSMLQNYVTITKLGHGSLSTVWLCLDRKNSRYVVVKVPVAQDWRPAHEMDILDRIKHAGFSKHPGMRLIRRYTDSFEVSAKMFSKHTCIVYEPLGPSLKDVRAQSWQGRIPVARMKPMIKHMLTALDFLHTKCDIIHTDIHAGNWLLNLANHQPLEELHKSELMAPSAPYTKHGKTIYETRNMPYNHLVSTIPILCDLACAVVGKEHHGQATPDILRPPEMILRLPWSEKIDIWCLALVIWYCIQGRHWYEYKYDTRKRTEMDHMAWTIALLGKPDPLSVAWIQTSKRRKDYFDDCGNFRSWGLIPRLTLADKEVAMMHDAEQREQFLHFLSRMLQWRPECRASARDLLDDLWLHSEVDE